MTTFLVPKNNAASTLASDVTDVATTWVLAAGEGALFPSTYPFNITCEDEIAQCSNRSTDTLTVIRAQEGTTGAAHAAGKAVRLNITAKAVSDLNTAVNTLEDAPPAHKTSHQDTGADEISIAGLDGEPSTLTIHKDLTTGIHGVATNKVTSVSSQDKTYYIDHDATGTGDGLSWANAFTTFAALWAMLPDVILHIITVYVAGTAYDGIHLTNKNIIGRVAFYARSTANKPLYDQGIASGGAAGYIQDTTKSTWVANQFDGGTVFIYWGTGKGQYRTIAACPDLATDQKLYVTADWTTTPDATSRYVIVSPIVITYAGNFAWSVHNISFYGFQFVNSERITITGNHYYIYYCKLSLAVYGLYLLGAVSTQLFYNLHLVHSGASERGVYSIGSVGTLSEYSLYIATSAGNGIGFDAATGSVVSMWHYNHFVDLNVGIRALVGSFVGYTTASYVSFSGCTTDRNPALGTDPSAIF